METKIISLVNHKGGVGKTTSTLNLGKALSLLGKKVLIIDIDPQSNLSQSVGIDEPKQSIYDTLCEGAELFIVQLSHNFYIAPANLSLATAEMKLHSEQVTGFLKMKKELKKIKDHYDYILFDCPPSLGILTINALLSSTEFVIVAEPEYLSIAGLKTILDLVENIKEDLNVTLHFRGILFTQVGRTIVNKGVIKAIKEEYENKLFESYIRENAKIAESSLYKQDIFSYDKNSAGALDYQKLAIELLK